MKAKRPPPPPGATVVTAPHGCVSCSYKLTPDIVDRSTGRVACPADYEVNGNCLRCVREEAERDGR